MGMVIQPKVRGFVCITAHPEGCAAHVREQIARVQSQGPIHGPKKVLVLGASTGYGLSSRIVSAFGCGAATLGVFFERPGSDGRTASAGWYNAAAFHAEAQAVGLWAKSLNGDAFSDELKQQAVALIKEALGAVDLVVYSLASPRRTHPKTGTTHKSCLKPIGAPYTAKTLDTDRAQVTEVSVEPASEDEIADTVAVMGGEDWELWINALRQAGCLAPGATTVAYDYVGPEITWPIYRDGTIGRAKQHLLATAAKLNAQDGLRALLSVNKAVVTQASSAIPVVPLYISLLFKVMKKQGLHEGCIEQIDRLFRHILYGSASLDAEGRARLDDRELRDDIQAAVKELWPQVTTENLMEISDFAGYRADFLKLFGFGLPGIDYDQESETEVELV